MTSSTIAPAGPFPAAAPVLAARRQPTALTPAQPGNLADTVLFSAASRRAGQKSNPQKTAIYAGSFDPPTLGHLSVIEQGANMYGKLLVTIAVNPHKKTTFTLEERKAMLLELTKDMPNVEIRVVKHHLIADIAQKHGVDVLIRGIRNGADADAESLLANVNRVIAPNVETVTFLSREELAKVSSSMVKSLMPYIGWRDTVRKMVPPLILNRLEAKYLEGRFAQLADALKIPPEAARPAFERLIAHYQEPGRAYHNLDHVIDLLEKLDALDEDDFDADPRHADDAHAPERPRQPLLLELALWFHDMIDDRFDPDGIAKNAQAAVDLLKTSRHPDYQDTRQQERLRALIMATAGHRPADSADPLDDTPWMLDLDLSILGASPERYKQYARGIREEYGHVDPKAYQAGRARLLEAFQSRETLYHTAWGQAQFEAQARKNLAREIRALNRA